MTLRGREILLGVTGGIAAYKAADLCSKLVQQEACVSVIMTQAAHQFIGQTTFEALTGRPVNSDPFTAKEHYRGEHIGLAQRADLVLIAPATAATLARLASGLADDLLTTYRAGRDRSCTGRSCDELRHVGQTGRSAQRETTARRWSGTDRSG